MKLTRRQFKILIEGYLFEQEEDESVAGEPPADEEEVEEEPVDEEEVEEEPVDEEEVEPEEPDLFKSFEVVVDGIKHKVQFVKDVSANVLRAEIDGTALRNPKPQHFVTLAGIGLSGVKDEVLRKQLEKIVKHDKSFEKFTTSVEVANQVKRKIDGSRKGFSIDDIRKIGLGKLAEVKSKG